MGLNKRTLIGIFFILFLILMMFGFRQCRGSFLESNDTTGSKEVHLEIYSATEGIDECITVKTDATVLIDLLRENEDFLDVKIEEYENDNVLIKILGGKANYPEEFWEITLNDERGVMSISNEFIEDGDTYIFWITSKNPPYFNWEMNCFYCQNKRLRIGSYMV